MNKIKIALFGSDANRFAGVFTPDVLARLGEFGELSELIDRSKLDANAEFLKDCRFAFSTWGMPCFSKEEIEKYMPSLQAVFYSAGSVQAFARPFLEKGIKVFSAFAANAVPVADYTCAQITLALKGYFQGAKLYRAALPLSFLHTKTAPGGYRATVGLVGLGTIGTMVAKRLGATSHRVLAYDPFASPEKAESLGVELVELETLFRESDVVSNHLANKKELKNIFSYKYFKLMKKHSVFINTGRGAQVNQLALSLSLILHPSRTAVLDVLKGEVFPYINPLFWCPNAVITPHIAGSMGNERQAMAYSMIDQLENLISEREAEYEVTAEMLERMA